ncbi:MarR family transcriptional regulator [Actinomadura spongiicola]|uniref:MarR family transcriptional regulator n=1 Tax=Actinomadura spongiicola TaxID=2303421 RepID=A0A372G7F4_9ACTN|nr:MarR family transcriptional regulator [Actinomadura spongiicola]RFS81072.1 MarR family transcriptional regulator [Actinomadura spongiicola]
MENSEFCGLRAIGPAEEWPIGQLFTVAARLSTPATWRVISRHGMSPVGFFLLRQLIVEDGLRPSEIAKRLAVTPATVTSVVDTLERNGHVRRERSYRDRRGVMLRITDSGRGLLAEKAGPIGRDLDRLYDVVDEGDEAAVRRFLLNLITRFGTCPNTEDETDRETDREEAKGDGA